MNELLMFYNPIVYKRPAGKKLDDFLISGKEKGINIKSFSLDFLREGSIAPSRLESAEGIIIAGGDGTLNSAVNYLLRLDCVLPPLGVLPLGTANDFAYQLTAGDLSERGLLEAIMAKNTIKADIGKLNDTYFVNVAAVGILAEISHTTSDDLKGKLGMLAYYLEGIKRLTAYKPFSLLVDFPWGKEQFKNVYLFLILNSQGAGGFRHLLPRASLNDGLLHLVVFNNLNRINELVSLLPVIQKGLPQEGSFFEYYRVKNFSVQGQSGIDTIIDGELGPSFPFDVKLYEKCLTCFCLKK